MFSTRNILLAATLATTTTLLGACGTTLAQRIDSDIAQQSEAYRAWWDQQVAYHRDSNVYFSPGDKEYYYFEDGHWNQAMTLPSWITLSQDDITFVKRRKLLSVTGNSTDVMAFNPHYQPMDTPAISSEDESQLTLVDEDAFEANLADDAAFEMIPMDDSESQVTLVNESGEKNE